MRIAAVVFDLDGTLVDSAESYFLADQRVMALHGVRHGREADPAFGSGNRDVMAKLAERYRLAPSVDALCAERDRVYLELFSTVRVYPEMMRFWDLCRGERVPLAVASGSSVGVLSRVVERIGLGGQAGVLVSSDEVAHGKPAPDVFLEAARRLAVPPGACLVVEDSPQGVEAARRAGMRCIAVPREPCSPVPAELAAADLLFAAGAATFDAARAHAWLIERLA